MKRTMMMTVAAVVFSVFGATAVAKTNGPAAHVSHGDKTCAEQRKINPKADCALDIDEGEKVTGQIVKPSGDMITGNVQGKNKPLVPNRDSMVDKIVKSGDDIQ
jgi:hypothetical protein